MFVMVTYNSSLRYVAIKAQWLDLRSGNLPWSLTSIQLSLYKDHTLVFEYAITQRRAFACPVLCNSTEI